jgi:hypothetical protein
MIILLIYLCNLLAVLASDAQNAAVKDQPSASSVCPDMNFFNTAVMKGSALISHIMSKMLNGRVKSSAKVVTILAKHAMDPNKINAKHVVLMVHVDRHSIESPLLVNAYALNKWQK